MRLALERKEFVGEAARLVVLWEAKARIIVKCEQLLDTMEVEFQSVKSDVAMVQGWIDDDHALKDRADKQERDLTDTTDVPGKPEDFLKPLAELKEKEEVVHPG